MRRRLDRSRIKRIYRKSSAEHGAKEPTVTKKNGEKTDVTLADVVRAIQALTGIVVELTGTVEELKTSVEDGFAQQRRDIASALDRDRKLEGKLAGLVTRVAKLERRHG
jgi:hypothetical protein